MRTLVDFEGNVVRITDERWLHILEHPEMRSVEHLIGFTLRYPEHVILSLSDSSVRLYYRWVRDSTVGGKHLCVAVKVLTGDAFVVTAYLTDSLKRGARIWPVEK